MKAKPKNSLARLAFEGLVKVGITIVKGGISLLI